MSLIREFKPALIFLAKFLAIYFIGNILYGIFIESYGKKPDPVTGFVTLQTAWVLNQIGYSASATDYADRPQVALKENEKVILNVFEGCNGINVMIVFTAFLFAFGGPKKALIVFLTGGTLVIHIFNLLRIGLLFNLALNNSRNFYYFHKYFFTATLYLVVFILWAIWIFYFNEKHNVRATT